jgi:hypothetical protein
VQPNLGLKCFCSAFVFMPPRKFVPLMQDDQSGLDHHLGAKSLVLQPNDAYQARICRLSEFLVQPWNASAKCLRLLEAMNSFRDADEPPRKFARVDLENISLSPPPDLCTGCARAAAGEFSNAARARRIWQEFDQRLARQGVFTVTTRTRTISEWTQVGKECHRNGLPDLMMTTVSGARSCGRATHLSSYAV